MEHPTGEGPELDLRIAFDRRLALELHASGITSDAGLLAFRELDEAPGLSAMAGEGPTGTNGRHSDVAKFPRSVFGGLAGYEDVNDADRPAHGPAMHCGSCS